MRSAKPMPGWRRVAPTWACATRSDPAFHLEMQLDAGAKAPAFFCRGSTNPTYGAAVPEAPMGFAALYPSYGHGAGQPESGAAFGMLCCECLRSAERRVGKECVSTRRSRVSPNL